MAYKKIKVKGSRKRKGHVRLLKTAKIITPTEKGSTSVQWLNNRKASISNNY